MDKTLNTVSSFGRKCMMTPAKWLNTVSGGRVKPSHVTLVSLLGHVWVLWALWQSRPLLAALLLAFFGLMDALDGALSRVQKSSSVKGMFYDASSDRVKEVLLYIGLHVFLFTTIALNQSSNITLWLDEHLVVWNVASTLWIALAVLGMSLVVSYVKAKGEMALSATKKQNVQQLNKVFGDGIARYEVRMALIIIGLLTSQLALVLYILLALLVYTALMRTVRISRVLAHV